MKRSLAVAFLCSLIACLFGCSLLPEWRVFQKKVPATLTEKPKAQAEGERQAAAFIRQQTTPPVPDPVKAVARVYPVAAALSASLGEPLQAIEGDDPAKTLETLRQGLIAKETQLEAWKAFGRKYAGKELEGTGFDLAGPAGLVAIVGLAAAVIMCPAVGWVLLRVIPVLWGMIRRIMTGVENFAVENPDAAGRLKEGYLSRTMNEVDKKIIKRRKAKLRPTDLSPGATNVPFPTQ